MEWTKTIDELALKATQPFADKRKKPANPQIIEQFLVSQHHDSLQIVLIDRTNL